ncbi:MAG: AMP-binding protein [Synechococcales bacterium]|nr:AMP-binding protein [Synechococcales bacterium]
MGRRIGLGDGAWEMQVEAQWLEQFPRLQERLIGVDSEAIAWLTAAKRVELIQLTETLQQGGCDRVPCVVVAEGEPEAFLAGILAALRVPCAVFLGNPGWGTGEWQQVYDKVQPDRIWGLPKTGWGQNTGVGEGGVSAPGVGIYVPTGGSSGQLRFAHHTWDTLQASIAGTWDYFDRQPIHSLCVLPLYHVSGLLQFLRSGLTQGQFLYWSWKRLEQGEFPDRDLTSFFLSLVPTQLQRLVELPLDPHSDPHSNHFFQRLQTLRAILLGGAPAWATLLDRARGLNLPIAPTYGMTETASQVATLKPQDFLAGRAGVGKPLPHAQIRVVDEQGKSLPAGQIGQLLIQARSQMVGYFPPQTSTWEKATFQSTSLQSDDLGYFDGDGFLHLLGRSSDKIISGGENIHPVEVEAAIRTSPWVADVAVVGVPDPKWGERVVALYVPASIAAQGTVIAAKDNAANNKTINDPAMLLVQQQAQILQQVATQLARYKLPKQWIALESLPRNAQGKLNRQQLRQALIEQSL